jgi:hypothetical protein
MNKVLKSVLIVMSLFATSAAFADTSFTYYTDNCREDVALLDLLASVTNGSLIFNVSCGPGGVGNNGSTYSNSISGSYYASASSGNFSYDTDQCQEDVALLDLLASVTDGSLIFNVSCGPGGVGSNGSSYSNSISGSFQVN